METKIADAVDAANGIFLTRGSTSRAVKSAQLLMIVSDGRGVFSKGVSAMKAAVRKAKLAGVFIIFIIIDNPNAKVICVQRRQLGVTRWEINLFVCFIEFGVGYWNAYV